MWTKKYEPKIIREIVGQDDAIKKIREWLKNPRRGLLASGPPGTGKTVTAHVFAKELGWEFIEMNASDFRKKADVNERLMNAAMQKSLFNKGKLILVDEVDGIAGRKDFGAVKAIELLIQKSPYPVYLTCNNGWSNPVKSLRKSVTEVKFSKPKISDVMKVLEKISESEGLKINRGILLQIASPRDIRSAISDLQALGSDETATPGERNRGKTVFDTLQGIFKSKNAKQARSAIDGMDKTIDELLLWLDENISKEYQGKDVSKAYDALSRADVFRGRIFRRQDWKLLKYVIDLATIGVAMAKSQDNTEFIRYAPPSFLIRMGRSKEKRAVRKGLLKKIAEATHSSSKVAAGYLPVVKMMAENGGLPFEVSPAEIEIMSYGTLQ